ncbi:glycoside hydrolase 43 family protein [Acidipila sp. 4G-K13]|nr:glycoside hydrolase 43 family protein [Paracidobacterium acidisoli]
MTPFRTLRPSMRSLCVFPALLLILLATVPVLHAASGDEGNGRYRNPVLFSDYSDPDVIRFEKNYYLVASSFHFMPGIPVLESHDLVNWHIVSHVFPRLDIDPKYSMVGGNRYAQGAWAPSIRYHKGRFYVYFPTPKEGIFMSSAPSPKGPWTVPAAVIAGPGYEDPCPFWDDDGNAYLVHSRVGAGPLILHRMSEDGTKVLDDGKVIVDDPKLLPTLEGPKLYKRHGYYYIFAPFGGVGTGAQAVLRAKNIYGPWESRTVLEQGTTKVNGPHQGGLVDTPGGQSWFIHFSQRGGYGRILYLEPVQWKDGWPIIGSPIPGGTAGQPVADWPKPDVGKTWPIETPQTSDEFSSSTLGLQWEWNHNPDDSHWSLKERPGYLRLKASYAPDLIHARNTLTQQMEHESFDLTTRIDTSGMKDGERAGLVMFGFHASSIGIEQTAGKRQIVYEDASGKTTAVVPLQEADVQFRMHVADQQVSFSYSVDDGRSFQSVGSANPFYFSWWKAARPALFNYNTQTDAQTDGWIDVDWVRCYALPDSDDAASMSPPQHAGSTRP